MISYEVVRVVLAAEGAVLAIVVIAIFWHALALRARAHRREPHLEAGRAILYQSLANGSLSGVDADALCHFSRGTLIRLFADLAPNLTGDDRERLGEIGERCGLVAYAERQARSRYWWRRLHSARLFTLFARVSAPLLALSRDDNELVRAQAAEAIGLCHSPDGIARLIELLSDPAPMVRFMARDSLIRIGRPAHGSIADALIHGSAALEPLLSIASTSPSHDFAAAVTTLSTDERPRVRSLAADTLRAIGGGDSAALLMKMLSDPDCDVRIRAIDGLASLGYWPAAAAIARLIDDEDWQVRERAAVALQHLGGPGELLLRRAADGRSVGAPIARRVLDVAAVLRTEVRTTERLAL